MKKKLIQVLKTLYASKGFKANELEELADVLSSSLKEDSTDEEISNVANGAESYVNMLQKVGNRYASAIEEKYKGYVKPNTIEEGKTKPIEENTLTKEAIAKLISEGIAEAIKPIQQQRESERLSRVLSDNEKLKGIPAKFISRYKLEKKKTSIMLPHRLRRIMQTNVRLSLNPLELLSLQFLAVMLIPMKDL